MSAQSSEGYSFLDHTSDALVEAWGSTLERALVQAAVAFYDIMIDGKSVDPKIDDTVTVEGHDEYELLYEWLEALLLRFDIDGMVYSDFRIDHVETGNNPLNFQAIIGGEKYDRQKHGAKVEIKGVTYHIMEIDRQPYRVRLKFLLDL